MGEMYPAGRGLKSMFEALRHFGEMPGAFQVVMLIGAVAVLVLGGMFFWRVLKTVIRR